MASKIKLTGNPLEVRKEYLDNTTIYCVDFVEGGKSNPPKGLPKPSKIMVTALLNEKQYKKTLFKRSLKDLFVLIEGEVIMDVPSSFTKGEFAVICFKIEVLEIKEK